MTHRKRLTALVVPGAPLLVLMAWALGMAAGPASAHVRAHKAPQVTVVNVSAGSPSELTFTLSKFSNLPVGKITFKVTNKGAIAHNFKVCSVVVASANVFACLGKATPTIQPGKSATLTLTLKKGKYEYLCSIPGHASAGMKGLFGVGVKVTAPSTAKPVVSTTPTSTAPSSSASQTCASPQTSAVTVSMFEFGYTVSPSSVPCGTITFTVKNTGSTDHDFVIEGLVGANGRSNILGAGESQTITTTLTPGTWTYYCSVPTHRSLGMEGKLTIAK